MNTKINLTKRSAPACQAGHDRAVRQYANYFFDSCLRNLYGVYGVFSYKTQTSRALEKSALTAGDRELGV
jgi:hypothetical protein